MTALTGRLHLDVDLDELRARPDGPKNIKLAEEAELKMASLDFPLITTTTLALDRKKRPIAAYFSNHFSENDIIIYDNARVCVCLCSDTLYLNYYTG